MNKDFFINNRKKVKDTLEDNSILVLFSGEAPQRSADQPYKYTINRHFYYLTGLERQKFILMITKKNGKLDENLFIEKPNPQLEKWIGRRMRKEEAKEISGIEKIQFIENFEAFFNGMLLRTSYDNVYLDLERRGWSVPNTAAIDFANNVTNKYPYLKIINAYNMISNFRMIKSKEEIEKMKEAVAITTKGVESLMENSKPGMMEYQLEAYFDFEIKTLGAKEHAFKTIAAAGKNATVLHYEENNCEMKDGDLILFDLGAEYENYCADISRTFPVNGKFTDKQKQFYNIVLKAMDETIKAIKPGVPFKELNNITKKVLADECKKIGLIKEDSEIAKYYYHGVSHFIGLDTHDVGDYDTELKPGMVLTVEPGLYVEEEEIGIRIEDDILVTEDGYENLSKGMIKTIEEIEKFMSK
ncbi:aminopeptidase P family protein [Dethiothermospora halolimnae]|uniref:aminopeptidase P family protein n=1 Tax=Dethiothermospora halolimnae TaxID=3114390 RepID=UPI003CCC3B4F